VRAFAIVGIDSRLPTTYKAVMQGNLSFVLV
jgi:hypothetical protein